MGVIQELDDSLAASGQSTQHTAAAHVLGFMGVVVLVVMSSLHKHWCEFHLVAASLLSLLNLHLEDLAFLLNLLSAASQGQEIPTAKLDQQVMVC